MTSSTSTLAFNPHTNGPESLESMLRKTTRKPLYCHPNSWCDEHLDVLRVEGLDQEYPIEHVLQYPVGCGHSDKALMEAIEPITAWGERVDCDYPLGVRIYHFHRIQEMYLPPSKDQVSLEDHMTGFCAVALRSIRKKVRGYPMETDGRRGGFSMIEPSLRFYVGTGEKRHSLEMKTGELVVDYPDFEGYPDTFFPLVVCLCRHHDNYNPWKTKDLSVAAEARRLKRWRKVSKLAEMIAVLIAMAQQQAKRLVDGRNTQQQCCPNSICPLLIWVDNTALRFVRAHVPRSHLDALADPTKPIIDTLRVEISQPLNMQEREDQIRLMFCLAALLDQHFLVFRPANLMNQTKA